ncbi:preprotein translocase subunit SecG [Cellulosilyticum ruminicola]|uniref:preprotein translocase subunit SecG n=1 Tax=Cellulosilyticum ruminicola TaxID=425254 RepID=UPI0009F9B0CA|nr:preprotein translocase subunit SecG [Cellulosilyticum ruminicola]
MEILKLVITVLFVIAALAIIVVVLLQEGKSAGLGSLNGSTGNSDSYWEKNKKNTLEGKFETWTKITAGLFVVFALVLMLMNSNGKVAQTQVPATNVETTTDQNAEATTEGEAATTDVATEATDAADNQAANEADADNADATTDNAQESATSSN